MDIDEPGWQLLDDFFAEEAFGRTAPTVRRYARVRGRLMTFLDHADMAAGLGTHPATLLDAEREFHGEGAFWVLFGPDELVCCLPTFLQPSWMPEGLAEVRTQISLVARLLGRMKRHHLLDLSVVSCAYWDAETAVAAARAQMPERAAAKEPDSWATEMPSRFESPPGAEW